LVLYDGEAEISSDNINTLLTKSGNNGVKPYWPALFAGALKGGRMETIIFSGGAIGGGDAGAAAAAPAAGGGAPAAAENPKDKPQAEVGEALAGGLDLLGGRGGVMGYN
jgi:ribosomal protein L12E/L44/L45/RPP1/RPP2